MTDREFLHTTAGYATALAIAIATVIYAWVF